MSVYYGNSSLNSNYRGRLEFTETTNTSANTSTITWTFKLYRSDGYSSPYNRSTGNHCTLTIDGAEVYNSTSFSVVMANATSESSAYQIASGSFTVAHNADGAKTISFSAKYWNTNSDSIGSASSPLTVSGTHTCVTIPRASSVSATNTTMGENCTITITKASSSFTHTITYSFGSSSGTLATKTSNTSVTWSVPISLANQIPNSKTGTCTFTCTTYNGNTAIGSKTATCTLTVPSSAAPTLSVASAVVDGFSGHYVQGRSKCKLTFTTSTKYGATISKRTVNNATITSPWTSGTLTSSGNVTFTCVATDSRGYTASQTITISVDAYAVPTLTDVEAFRCDSSGAAADSGTYISAKATAHYSSVSGTNTATLTCQYRVKGGSYSTAETMTSGTALVVGAGGIATNLSYDVLIMVTDAIGNSAQVTLTIPTETVMLDLRADMNGVAWGTYANTPGAFLINPNWIVSAGAVTQSRPGSRNAFGEFSFHAVKSNGTAGYLRIARLHTNAGIWLIAPIKFELFRRRDIGSTSLFVSFANVGSADPNVETIWFDEAGEYFGAYAFAYKADDGLWDIYVEKSEPYDEIGIITHIPPYLSNSGITVSYENDIMTSIPSGAKEATRGFPIPEFTSGTDLNSLTRHGQYRCGSNSIASSLGHSPTSNAFRMVMYDGVGDNRPTVSHAWAYPIQELVDRWGDKWIRSGATGSGTTVTWQSWKKVTTS